jgi:hypothetical protein
MLEPGTESKRVAKPAFGPGMLSEETAVLLEPLDRGFLNPDAVIWLAVPYSLAS